MAPHSSTLAWRIPWMEEPGRLQSMGSLRVGRLSDFTFTFHFHALEKEMATLQCSCLENPRDGGAWWAAVSGVAQSRTRLKQLSSSSSSMDEMVRTSKTILLTWIESLLGVWGLTFIPSLLNCLEIRSKFQSLLPHYSSVSTMKLFCF